jgi:hypothetical protein
MGTEATKSNDNGGTRRSWRATSYHFFLLSGGTLPVAADCRLRKWAGHKEETMHGLIYLVGLIVVILAVLSFFGLR